jgi:hypothetical protein
MLFHGFLRAVIACLAADFQSSASRSGSIPSAARIARRSEDRNNQSGTPIARVAVIENRLNATLQEHATFEPALTKFDDSQSTKEKGRFDRLIVRPA